MSWAIRGVSTLKSCVSSVYLGGGLCKDHMLLVLWSIMLKPLLSCLWHGQSCEFCFLVRSSGVLQLDMREDVLTPRGACGRLQKQQQF
ncbi:hypothetical protein GOP47_0002989 [Adiantum capillus-veneris]|uniref:Uncharacterized protein n=1 Tax=Adiantum capillus-veneris TaxID=13818 RepID=A0A9D4ZRF1_ADICA|nr:hypothetical protein GOP47_0002989 [Adiantum capillus-veneris]